MNRALPMGPWSWAAVALATVVGLLAFGWPFLAEPGSAAVAHASDAPWIFAAVIPLDKSNKYYENNYKSTIYLIFHYLHGIYIRMRYES